MKLPNKKLNMKVNMKESDRIDEWYSLPENSCREHFSVNITFGENILSF